MDFAEGRGHLLLVGDFNRHHPLWDSDTNTQFLRTSYLEAAQPLLDILADFDLQILLPKGIPTFRTSTGNLTRPDNVFGSPGIVDSLISCNAHPELQPPIADHFPIVTEVLLETAKNAPQTRFNWQKTDWAEFRNTLKKELPPPPGENIASTQQFDSTLQALQRALGIARDLCVKQTNVSIFTRRWWTDELNEKRKEVSRLGRKALPHKSDPTNEYVRAFHKARNKYGEMVKFAKKDCWEAWLETADMRSIWQMGRLAKSPPSDGGRTRIPPLSTGTEDGDKCSSNTGKSDILYRAFFPPPAAVPDFSDFSYPDEKFSLPQITDNLIIDVVKSLKDYKASGPDGIPNEVYKRCSDILLPFLGPLFRATFTLDYYPDTWKISDTVVLKKPKRDDYSLPGSYRPIALLNCLSKILSGCVAKILVYKSERLNLLADTHFLGRPGRSTTDSLHLMLKTVKDAWRRRKTVSTLFLDITAAFPSATPEVLFHNMRKRGVPKKLIDWLRRKLTGRKTRLKFDDHVSALFDIISGIDQGCPLSVILFQFYNSDLPTIGRDCGDVLVYLNIDDAMAISIADSRTEAIQKLETFMSAPGGAANWSNTHNSKFDIKKFHLLNMEQSSKELGPPLVLQDKVVKPCKCARFLGVQVDYRLRFKEHLAHALAKGASWVKQFRRLARTASGIPQTLMRRLYLSIAIPSMLYAADIFLNPISQREGQKRRTGSIGFIKQLSTVHRQALILITGAMRTSPTDILEAHANLPPLDILINRICHRETTRLCTLPPSHPLAIHVRRAARHPDIRKHRAPLHNLMRAYRLLPDEIETIPPVQFPPGWRPPFKTVIPATKDEAKRDEESWIARDGIRIYSDGSDFEGGVGAAALLFEPGQLRVPMLKFHLGPSAQNTVFEAELMGLILALELLRKRSRVRNCSIAVDNKAAITAVSTSRVAEADYLVGRFHTQLKKVKKTHPHLRLTLRWVPGHVGIRGNERVDKRAKEAACQTNVDNNALSSSINEIFASSSKLRQTHYDELKSLIAERWSNSPRYRTHSKFFPSLPSTSFAKLTEGLPRRHVSILTQLRSGHAPLQYHLHKLGKVPSPLCPTCGIEKETVHHFLMTCPGYRHFRDVMRFELGRPAFTTAKLLNSRRTMKPLFKFINRTRRLEPTFGDVQSIKKRQPFKD